MELSPSVTVRARGRRFVVMDVAQHATCRSVRLAPREGEDVPLTLLQPYDRLDVVPVTDSPKWAGRRRVAHVCAAAIRAAHRAGDTRSAIDARIHVMPYQLEPVLAVLRGETTRVLLADEVGLGKTVQAGLILSELRARHALRRALVLTPAGLREQWIAELRERFNLEAAPIDAGVLAAAQRALPPSVNPWTVPGIAVVSIDLLKRRELLPQLEHVVWDAVVVDEAHHAARGTERHAAATLACDRARIVVLVTATPHSGDRSAFEDLCAVGSLDDPRPIRVFRRTREDVCSGAPIRRTRVIRVARTVAERQLSAALRRYTARVWRESAGRADRQENARLAMIVLRKRALSGHASLARSLARRLTALDPRDAAGEETQLSLDFEDSLGGELIDDDREPAQELGAPGLADGLEERAMLARLLESARAATATDSKAARLVSAVCSSREPAIVFTEYRDTLEDLRRRCDGHATVAILHGAMLPGERRQAIAAFESGRARVLLATDAAAEGLNLHRRCRWVIHLEVPWNPVRIEQRNGRVDRLGQTRRVHVWHLIAADTEEDEVLTRLAVRSAIAARDLQNEDEVSQAVIGESELPTRESPRAPAAISDVARREATRIGLLRRLPRGRTAPPTPVLERGLSAGRLLLTVFRLTVLDRNGRTVSSDCVGVEGTTLDGCHRRVHVEAVERAARDMAVDRHWSAALKRRADAVRAALGTAKVSPIQTSLFDRRPVRRSEYQQAEVRRALAELDEPPQAVGDYAVRVSMVGALAQRHGR